MLYYIYSKRRKDGIIITEEIWKDIEGYEGYYQVSNMGRIKSLERKCKCCGGGTKTIQGKVLKLADDKGYLKANLLKEGKVKRYFVHRLVAIAFLSNENNYPCVNHKDENRRNNNVSNLEWCTHEYNNNYGTRKEKASKTMKGKFKGEKHPFYGGKHTAEAKEKMGKPVICVTTGEVFKTAREAAIATKTGYTGISFCCKGRYKTSGKHPITGEPLRWKFLEKESEE